MTARIKGETGRAVVAGATGYLGKFVVRALHRRGYNVRALARDAERLMEAKDSCGEVFVARATERESMEGLFDGAESAFSSIGIRHLKRKPTYEQVDFRANANLVEAAAAAGVKRFVFVSVLDGADLRRQSPLVDARERVVDILNKSSMEAVILRPTGFFNDMADVFRMARKGKVWLVGSGKTKINPIHGADLAEVAADVLDAESPDEEIPAGGPDVFSQIEIADLAFSVLGRQPRYGRVSPGLIRFLAAAIRPFNKNVSALAMMFSALGDRDGVAPCFGENRLPAFFESLARGDG
jgi:uncharacterized protein YbjT (DUF2867 family)